MSVEVRRVDYYHVTVRDRPGAAFRLLSRLARDQVNLLAFGAAPAGPDCAQLTVFPDDSGRLAASAERAGLTLEGPHAALLVRGDDRLGALAELHRRLADAGINVYSSHGVSTGGGSFGYLLYLRPDDVERALAVLGEGAAPR
ncbi:MAG: hypothetical protein D6718_06835 [Acidobacteria bacterium]|nr:MAG: hypothetical protein D6718_06835 [Acidobacteriota bacterium]